MKKIVPFKQEIIFKTNIAEITSISLEHSLRIEDELITGDFILSGEYKIADISTNTESFNYNLPFDIVLDDKYIFDKVNVDIDDFYYEIVNEKILSVNIDVAIDNLIEKPLMPEIEEEERIDMNLKDKIEVECEKDEINNAEEDRKETFDIFTHEQLDNEIIEHPIKLEEKIEKVSSSGENVLKENLDIFNSFDGSESFSMYHVYIVREGDTIDSILEKYNITREELEEYNDLSQLKIGDKLIIPSK